MKRTAEEVGLVVVPQQQQGVSVFAEGQETCVVAAGEGCDSSSPPQRGMDGRRVRARMATSMELTYEVSGCPVSHVPVPAQNIMNNNGNGGGGDTMTEALLQHASSTSKMCLADMVIAAGADANSVQQQQQQHNILLQQQQQKLPMRSASCPDFLRVLEQQQQQQQRAAEMERRRLREQMPHGLIH